MKRRVRSCVGLTNRSRQKNVPMEKQNEENRRVLNHTLSFHRQKILEKAREAAKLSGKYEMANKIRAWEKRIPSEKTKNMEYQKTFLPPVFYNNTIHSNNSNKHFNIELFGEKTQDHIIPQRSTPPRFSKKMCEKSYRNASDWVKIDSNSPMNCNEQDRFIASSSTKHVNIGMQDYLNRQKESQKRLSKIKTTYQTFESKCISNNEAVDQMNNKKLLFSANRQKKYLDGIKQLQESEAKILARSNRKGYGEYHQKI